jgi:hypothetical protein
MRAASSGLANRRILFDGAVAVYVRCDVVGRSIYAPYNYPLRMCPGGDRGTRS